MNVSLTPELEKYVSGKVATGMYTSASEVVREGLRLLLERDHAARTSFGEIHSKIEEGMADLEAGRAVDGRSYLSRLKRSSGSRRG